MIKKVLRFIMFLSLGVSVGNLLFLDFLPMLFPISNFSIIKLSIVAIGENNYAYVFISCIMFISILIGAIHIKKNRIILPAFSFIVYVADMIHVGGLFFSDLFKGFFNGTILFPGIIDIAVFLLFIMYFISLKKRVKE